MGKLLDDVKKYLKESSSEQLEKDWEELKKYNDEGPDIEDIISNSNEIELFRQEFCGHLKDYLPQEKIDELWKEAYKRHCENPPTNGQLILSFEVCEVIDKFYELEENWDGYGAVVPSEIVIENAKKFVKCIFNNHYYMSVDRLEDNIYPTPYGTIIIDVEPKDEYFVSIEIGKNAIGWFTKFGKDNYPEELMSDICETDFESLPDELKIALDKLYYII